LALVQVGLVDSGGKLGSIAFDNLDCGVDVLECGFSVFNVSFELFLGVLEFVCVDGSVLNVKREVRK
jgi:hypothetical protein